ncbi:gliding motility-associated C-terminal domain-containing protein [Christiangramia crocea]|uniref:Gliding motility-associated C-terminal domain-containing protein n=1 Tax=Christiangramia crocea TaxID=2904124 RepID=A0A9X1UTP9_9FLAO|nr:gliding motility-associated C-terminal domain-containing protein [Gramella crocea]MCG9970122.1 gliding motility-associated C-terminal domain-containing protein [Gramella crocea]
MQNFTLRGRRIKWFFFSFLLFVGTIPSIYGQCPTVTDPAQSFCNALYTVSDLQPMGATWYADETSSQPLPADELLIDGEDYYADSPDCTTPRSDRMVTVTITGPTAAPVVQDDFFTPCSGGGPYDVGDLKEAIDAEPAPSGYTLEVFQTRYTAEETPLNDTEPITVGNYYVGYSDGSGCETRRKPVRFEPVDAPAPAATSPQTVCEGTTVSELEAEGVNMWYRTQTSEPALSDDYVVQDGETYWATQIVPVDGPPCESEERTAVQVTVVSFDAGGPVNGEICRDDLQDLINSGTSAATILSNFIDPPRPGLFEDNTVTFNPTLTSVINDFEAGDNLLEFTGTFTSPEECTDDVSFTINVNPSYNAGENNTEGNVVCRAEFSETVTETEVEDYLTSLLSGNDPGGDFSNVPSITNDINNGLQGPFSSTYTVGAGQPCEDSADLAFEVDEAEDLGVQIGDGIFCQSEIDSRLAQTTMYEALAREIFLEQLDPSVPQDGDFENMTLGEVVTSYGNGTRAFSTTYSITTENGCTSSVDISIEIIPDYNAGESNTEGNEVCRAEFSETVTETEVEDYLTSLLSDDADEGGQFSNLTSITNDINAGSEGPFNSTYTVGEGEPCPDTAEFEFTVNNGADLDSYALSTGVTNVPLCNDDIPGLVNQIPEDVIQLYMDLIPGAPEGGEFDPSIQSIIESYDADNFQTFATTYSVTVDGCPDSILLSYTVTPGEAAEAGSFDDYPTPLCTSDEPLDLTTLTNNDPDAQEGGTFTGEGVLNNTFDPSQVDGAGVYTITYTVNSSVPCVDGEDFAEFEITVEESPISANISRSLCVTEAQSLISNPSEGYAYILGILDETGIETVNPMQFDPDPTLEAQRMADYIENPTSDPETFNFTYETISTNTCSDGAINLEITITPTQDAEAGEITPRTVCIGDGNIDLNDYLVGSGATTGGTFSGQGVSDNEFDPSIGVDTYTITYEVDASGDCVTPGTSDSTEFQITVTGSRELGPTITRRVCVDDFPDNEDDLTDYLAGLIGSNYSSAGTFAPSVADLMEDYNEEAVQTYETTYTLGSGDCEDSVAIEIEVFSEEAANAGNIDSFTVCSDSGMVILANYLSADATPGGTFTGEGVIDGEFDSSLGDNGTGYNITYTVDDSASCVLDGTEDSVEFTITVDDSFTIEADTDRIPICESNVDELFPNPASTVRAFYLDMLADDVPQDGQFEPTIQELINRYNNVTKTGDFTTRYTVTQGECSAFVDLTVEILELETIDIGAIPDPDPVCQNDSEVDLFSYLPDGMDASGAFEGYEDGTLDPSSLDPDTYDITYTIEDDANCTEGSSTFTLTISDAANAGEQITSPENPLTVCTTDAEINLFENAISADADMDGTFTLDGEEIEGGMMNPAEFDADTYTIIYTVAAVNDCGDDSVEITVVVNAAPDAPDVADTVPFCAIQSPTGADLLGDDDSLTFYTDEALSMMLTAEEELVAGTYYVTQTNDAGCESDAAEVEVTISDPGTPTTDDTNPEFCEYDDATIADLTASLDQTANITWYDSEDSMEPLSTGTALQDGVTYYASLYDSETDCDSSDRLAVTVTIEDCPLLFPEGISPNGDGMNDIFDIENIEREYPNYTIEIYNRWGDVVYKGNANTPEWDGTAATQSGTLGDDVLPVGVYFYLLDFNDGVTAPRRGKVYLSR